MISGDLTSPDLTLAFELHQQRISTPEKQSFDLLFHLIFAPLANFYTDLYFITFDGAQSIPFLQTESTPRFAGFDLFHQGFDPLISVVVLPISGVLQILPQHLEEQGPVR